MILAEPSVGLGAHVPDDHQQSQPAEPPQNLGQDPQMRQGNEALECVTEIVILLSDDGNRRRGASSRERPSGHGGSVMSADASR